MQAVTDKRVTSIIAFVGTEDSMVMNLQQLAELGVLTDTQRCIEFLRAKGLLAKALDCPKCEEAMIQEKSQAHKNDLCRWRCKNSKCRTSTTIRKGSFFEKSNIKLTNLVILIYFWAVEVPQRQIAFESGVSHQTVVDWTNFIRELCSSSLMQKTQKIGGPDHVICVDETHLARRKPGTNAQGRPTKALWLFGGIDIDTKQMFLELVPEEGRTAAVMEDLITRHIADGSTIWSDKFASYNRIEELGRGYVHQTVNHSYEYINSQGVHTNTVEGVWSHLKRRFKTMCGVARHLIPSYIDEYMWRRQFAPATHFLEILKAIATNPRYRFSSQAIDE